MSKKSFVKGPSGLPKELNNDKQWNYSLVNIWVASLALKLLLSVGYHSTDFDVHRNWLAITYNLPISKWYIENTSQWTLDYPPFFAYFEWVLASFVPDFVKRDGCLKIVEKGLYSLPTVLFQRLSVIVSEVVLFVSLQWYINSSKTHTEAKRAFVVASSLVLSPGLLIIDHIHFQYNGMLYGILVLMINSARLKKYLMCGFWFSILICFKHIYLYLAPAVFIFLLRAYCLNLNFGKTKSSNILKIVRWKNLFKLSSIVIAVFSIAFGPFIYYEVMPQLIERLFPFNRGLTHAYWAPNVWAIYSAIDRLLIQIYYRIPISRPILLKIFKFNPQYLWDTKLVNKTTRGLIGDVEFLILPTITSQLTFFLTLFYQVMALIPLFLQPTFRRFMGSLTLCGFASFLFGWHVHEKAVLVVIFPMTFLVSRDRDLLGPFNLLVSCAYISLFPLIFTCDEWLIKITYMLLWYIVYYFSLKKVVRLPKTNGGYGKVILDRVNNGYILGLVPVITIVSLIDLFEHKFEILRKLQFMKLLIISVYCGIGIISSWNGFSWLYFVDESIWTDE
ncbi:DEHA2D17028p [Debaryomyces hansenii CBS767]|jgi:alpha-1,3-glucosyltransferase|uniref:Dolichyl pyrophosphate Glc1Man9GlcNAc2 alpha-1,3-glucosyltransferase n=1 Tax=Debaryomyces hansenii (strain ATCC 36239 / CBS 767 / BCRC 21394 / JCM 1990 / NBRC 0083 / IGC 2968) TaxID=284592 RepID=ALG8_DEBHA|nr:DEHA2D17028p [Debaryomyces hansenii CBS767]Q6BRE5.1 RecName: Full=Dolichyl pyrophosphate Glc1Man9GlcNAc2 alpha-1,3-glucosyltransferase; AltName: Full=Asparagine-linked glycosylation protein 8; AltName: Full=Dol-P-Glc:Glc(1)Man(9)GlcNAc(2)-PP-dolichyl alpha-1,3-glucosyltransferase; AltName: Full=Dolichyl-P-Glc:Glc1Man9GlcNAc2-PP-dolichyl glucosyltransferase [Debaryomyces hansenii CBS767]CAG87397.1 DEHA2D17028p [Debaryomyces hansenii CBS767]|eukprot:XP_459225.1 DEHA2D17028p [Debaryomyces hansenii CBS767]